MNQNDSLNRIVLQIVLVPFQQLLKAEETKRGRKDLKPLTNLPVLVPSSGLNQTFELRSVRKIICVIFFFF